jgi:hypothetical protein
VTVIVSSVMGKGPVGDEPAVATELLPAAVLAPPIPLLTTPADSRGTAMIPSVTALLACVLAVLAFCTLSAACTLVKLIKLAYKIKILVACCEVIGIFRSQTKRLDVCHFVICTTSDEIEKSSNDVFACGAINQDLLVHCQINSKLAWLEQCAWCGE